jgi:hypothetical protein
MKKITIALLLSIGVIPLTEAGVCNKGSLAGQYRYQFSNRVGVITFSGAGGFTLSGFVVTSGGTSPVTSKGTYVVNTSCVATLTSTTGSLLTIYLDDMNDVPATRFAYHGTMLGGTLTRIIGK